MTGVASPEECARLETLFAEDLVDLIDSGAAQKASGAVANVAGKIEKNVRAFPLASGPLLGDKERCQLRGLPHGRFAWGARLLSNVRHCYEVMHGTKDLVSSCDNSFFSPSSSEKQTQNRSWPHVDHNRNDNRFFDVDGQAVGNWEVYQGILYVWSSEGEHASTTVVLPGSHLDTYKAMMRDPTMVKRGSKGSLGIPHYLVRPELPAPTAARNGSREEDAQLPLKASIQLASLRPGVNVTEMWNYLKEYVWESPLPAEVREYLLGILTEDVRRAL